MNAGYNNIMVMILQTDTLDSDKAVVIAKTMGLSQKNAVLLELK